MTFSVIYPENQILRCFLNKELVASDNVIQQPSNTSCPESQYLKLFSSART